MTPEERAAKIIGEIRQYFPDGPHKDKYLKSSAFAIAAEIREAVEEGLDQWESDNGNNILMSKEQLVTIIDKAKAKAYEDAAKIVEEKINDCWDIPPSLVDLIRALKEEVLK